MSTLKLTNLSKRFGGVVASEDVNIEVPAGKIIGLIGPNGAGKTTIINMITGMLAVSGGEIHVGDIDITHAPAHEICRAGLARTFQNIRLLGEATVLENVMIGFHRHEKSATLAAMLGLPSAGRETVEIKERALVMLKEFDLQDFADYPATGLSYGHQRKVEMARAMAAEPNFVLLDEPIAGMNNVESDALAEVFQRLASAGKGVLLIEHNVRFVAKMCSYVYVLDGGRLISQGTPDHVLSDPAVISAYLGDQRYA
jgi:branched-chain amino acid transport system ATP-binding protein|tara:strand:+ start:1921 stop:2688 length:768 start_codon:yes stop_codon:yes gene_type:complete